MCFGESESKMSLEEELAELSLVYHGQREYVEALQQLVRDLLFRLENHVTPDEWNHADGILKLRHHAKALLEGEGDGTTN